MEALKTIRTQLTFGIDPQVPLIYLGDLPLNPATVGETASFSEERGTEKSTYVVCMWILATKNLLEDLQQLVGHL